MDTVKAGRTGSGGDKGTGSEDGSSEASADNALSSLEEISGTGSDKTRRG